MLEESFMWTFFQSIGDLSWKGGLQGNEYSGRVLFFFWIGKHKDEKDPLSGNVAISVDESGAVLSSI